MTRPELPEKMASILLLVTRCLYYLPGKERVLLEICLSECVGLYGARVHIGIFSGLSLDGLWAPKVSRNVSKASF